MMMIKLYFTAFAVMIIAGIVLRIIELIFHEAKSNPIREMLSVFTIMFFGNAGKDLYLRASDPFSFPEMNMYVNFAVAMIVFTLWYICLIKDCDIKEEPSAKERGRNK